MTDALADPQGRRSRPEPSTALAWLAFFTGAILLAAPTLATIAQRSWSTDQGQYGALAVAIGLYLLVRSLLEHGLGRAPARPGVAAALFAAGAALHLFGRVASEYVAESDGLFILLVATVYLLAGAEGLRRSAFALAFLALSLPLPIGVLVPLSSVLRGVVVSLAEQFLRLSGLTIARDGISLFIDNHQIDIRQACSGMNSLVSLTLIGLAYLHLRRAPRFAYLAAMTPFIFFLALLANLLRVIVVALLTHAFGEAVGQGLPHELTGLLAFAAAMGLLIASDAAAGPRFAGVQRV